MQAHFIFEPCATLSLGCDLSPVNRVAFRYGVVHVRRVQLDIEANGSIWCHHGIIARWVGAGNMGPVDDAVGVPVVIETFVILQLPTDGPAIDRRTGFIGNYHVNFVGGGDGSAVVPGVPLVGLIIGYRIQA